MSIVYWTWKKRDFILAITIMNILKCLLSDKNNFIGKLGFIFWRSKELLSFAILTVLRVNLPLNFGMVNSRGGKGTCDFPSNLHIKMERPTLSVLKLFVLLLIKNAQMTNWIINCSHFPYLQKILLLNGGRGVSVLYVKYSCLS